MDPINSFIYVSFNEVTYLNIARIIIERELANSNRVYILDSSEVVKNQDYVNRKISRVLNVHTSKDDFDKWTDGLNVNHKFICKPPPNPSERVIEEAWSALWNSPEFQERLDSSLITFFSDTQPSRCRGYINKRNALISECRLIFLNTWQVFENNCSQVRAYVPNGRFVDQWTFIETLKRLQGSVVEIFFFEKGFTPQTYYIGNTSLLNRMELQDQIRSIQSISTESKERAKLWFDHRMDLSFGHEFTKTWHPIVSVNRLEQVSQQPVVTIFTSSQDEFELLGSMWKKSKWENQWKAFEAVIEKFSSLGYLVRIRVHPNFLNKSRHERKETGKILKTLAHCHPKLILFKASDRVNSYSLLFDSSLVVVWGSTIGLEAVRLGIPTMLLNASEWDESIDVVQILDESALESAKYPFWPTNPESALNYVGKRISLDREFHFNQYTYFEEPKNFRHSLAVAVGHKGKVTPKSILKVFLKKGMFEKLAHHYRLVANRRRETI
jgi:hypothetical protein